MSLWFPRLGADRLTRQDNGLADGPLAVTDEQGNMQVVSSLNRAASAAGVQVGQPLRDAHAMCATLRTRTRDARAETAFLTVLRRWSGKFSPWVAEAPPDGLTLDLTGCAHLFGGESALLDLIAAECVQMGLSVQVGVADTLGAAWALARFAGQAPGVDRTGDAIDQEARATRSRAGKRRHWTRGGAAPAVTTQAHSPRIAPPGQMHGALGPLPVAALRLEPAVVAQLNRLGLRRVGDLLGQPRAALARRFGKAMVLRLDQALGSAPEPMSPARPPVSYAVRLTLPDPIGLRDDLTEALARMVPRLCARLRDKGQGARVLQLELYRCDQTRQVVQVGLARASHDADRLRPLLDMKLDGIDAGFGIDLIRLEAVQIEPVHVRDTVGQDGARRAAQQRQQGSTALDDLIGRLGARVGLESITRRHPASSHIPEKTALVLAAAWSEPGPDWPACPARPLLLWRPEPVMAPDTHLAAPRAFRWRGRDWHLAHQEGPERIAPEWWLDDPDWRSGVRDYWIATTAEGDRLWLYYAYGGAMSAGWFCHGRFV